MKRSFVSAGAWLAFLAVALGAFGTHSLRGRISTDGLEIWRTAVQYHAIHALGLILVGILCASSDTRLMRAAGPLFAAGIVIFGGSLYALAVTGEKWLGAITPIGGLCFLAGWACLALSVRTGGESR